MSSQAPSPGHKDKGAIVQQKCLDKEVDWVWSADVLTYFFDGIMPLTGMAELHTVYCG